VSDETKITEVKVRNEHLREINQPAHWAYLFGVLLGALALMAVLIAILGTTGG
jgi:hypothetical protein